MMKRRIAECWHFCLALCLLAHIAYTLHSQERDTTNVHITNTDGKEHVINVVHVKLQSSKNEANIHTTSTTSSRTTQMPQKESERLFEKNKVGQHRGSDPFREPDIVPIITIVFCEMSPLCADKGLLERPKALCTMLPQNQESCSGCEGSLNLSKEILESYTDGILQLDMVPYKTTSEDVNREIVYGMVLLNTGYLDDAIEKFTSILQDYPKCIGCFVGRALAYSQQSLQDNYQKALDDLESAMKLDASKADIFLRRAEVLAPIGRHDEALDAINAAYSLWPSMDVTYFRAIVNLMKDDLIGAEKDFRTVLGSGNADLREKSIYYLAVTLYFRGKVRNAIEVYLDLLKTEPDDADALTGLAQAYKCLGNTKQAQQYFNTSLQYRPDDVTTIQLRATLFYSMGNLEEALDDVNTCLRLETSNTACLYMRGLIYTSLGKFYQGVKEHTKVLVYSPLTQMRISPEFVKAHYLREYGRYLHSRLDAQIERGLFEELPVEFKYGWMTHQWTRQAEYPEQPGLQPDISDVRDTSWSAFAPDIRAVVCRAKKLGALTQVSADGCLPNHRLNTAMGLASIHVAQFIEKTWKQSKNVDIKSGATSWRDVYVIAATYRRMVDPQLPVFWLENLSRDLLDRGVHNHYSFITGHVTNTRMMQYYDMVCRLLKAMVEHHEADGLVNYPGYEEEMAKVSTCLGLLDIIRKRGINQSGFMVTTQVPSFIDKKNGRLDGVVLFLSGLSHDDMVFGINQSITTARLQKFHEELDYVFLRLNEEVGRNVLSKSADTDGIVNLILTMAYYFYNLTPLSRGSSAVAYTVALGLLMAIGKEVTGKIPPGRLVDVEAMFSGAPDAFVTVVKQWMNIKKLSGSVSDFPQLHNILSTPREILEILNVAAHAQC